MAKETATLGAGCFWCVEAVLEQVEGVTEVRSGEGGVILTTGQMLGRAVETWQILKKEGMAPKLLHVPCPLALGRDADDPALLAALRMGRVLTYEDHNVRTGLGSRVANCIAARGISCRLLKLGIDRYAVSGEPDEVYRRMELDQDTLIARARKFLKR